ncbi:MAG: alpha/beta hydrolase [Pseudomonadota bacterium]
MDLFPGFETRRIELSDACLHVRLGGAGPPLLLLHGYPQSHVAWHAVAPVLADHFSLVVPDLPGYGDSLGPPIDADHINYSKRHTAALFVQLMELLEYEQFYVAAHDRGARVGYRLALDHPSKVLRLASLDTVPTLDIWDAANRDFALDAFHWPLLAQPAPFPEQLIGANPDLFLDQLLTTWVGSPNALDPNAVAEYRRCFRAPSVLQAMSEDYRAGATIDWAHDRADRDAGRRLQCAVFVPWGARYTASSPEAIWRRWADDVETLRLDCGHFIAEELPTACANALLAFFRS